MKKNRRQAEIKDIIKSYNVETQDELIARLRARGIYAAQATVSRDLRELHLTKVPFGAKSFKYALPIHSETPANQSKYLSILRDTIVHIRTAQNLIVIHTMPGMAQAAAAAIDGLEWKEIVGSIAGDDTIFLAMKSYEKADEYSSMLNRYISITFEDEKIDFLN